jgi:hypothetical protein
VGLFAINGAITTTTVSGYNANTNQAMQVANGFGANPMLSGYVECVQGGNAGLSTGDVATLNADLTQPPPSISGKTLERWIFEADIAANSGKLVYLSTERISGVDNLVRIGSPLQLAQRCDRLFSYETSPVWEGFAGASDTAYFSAAGGQAGSSATFGGVWIGSIDAQSGTSQNRVLCGKRDTTIPGWQLQTTLQNNTFQFTVGNNTASASPSSATIAATELGKLHIVIFWLDSLGVAHMMVRGVEVAVSSALSGGPYVPSTAALTLGVRASRVGTTDGVSHRGLIMLNRAPSAAEALAIHGAIMAGESIAAVVTQFSGMMTNGYDVTAASVAAGNAVPTTIPDLRGTDSLTKQGASALTYSPAYYRSAAA